jgi:hypothetical protein
MKIEGDEICPRNGTRWVAIQAPLPVDVVGLWVAWHLYGGMNGLLGTGISRATAHRRLAKFRRIVGEHPADVRIVGVWVNPSHRNYREVRL